MSDIDFGEGPDRIIHEPARLKIMSVLSVAEEADFTYLLNATGLTRGNLSVQLSRLEEAGYIEIEKGFVGKTPRTTARMTDAGTQAFTEYRAYLHRVLGAPG